MSTASSAARLIPPPSGDIDFVFHTSVHLRGIPVVANNNRGFFTGIIFQIFMLVALIGAGAMVVRYFTNKTLLKELGRCYSKYDGKIKKIERDKRKLKEKVEKYKKKHEVSRENEVLRNRFSKCISELKEERRPWWKLWKEEEKIEIDQEIKKLPPPPIKKDKDVKKERTRRRRRR